MKNIMRFKEEKKLLTVIIENHIESAIDPKKSELTGASVI